MMRLEHLSKKAVAVFLTAVLSFSLCAAGAAEALVTIKDAPVPLVDSVVYTPQTGPQSQSGGGATVDYSNASQGYIMVKYSGGSKKVKLLIKKGSTEYQFTLGGGGGYETFPLTMGDGSYKVGVYTNVQGDQYAVALTTTVQATISNSLSPYLYPNQYVNFNKNSATVKKGQELASGAANQLAIVQSVYNFCVGNISYDTQKAATVQSGYTPNVDSILSSGKGICFDYAAVMATMLRTQNIPTKLQVGYVTGGIYHAWISVWTPETGWINNIIQFDGKNWKLMDPTLASSGGANASFIGNGANYSLMYQY
jgi:hypothetical protein